MINDPRAARALLLALSIVFAAAAIAQQAQPAPKSTKPAGAAAPPAQAPAPQPPSLEPKAIDILKAACERLAAARTMRFTAVVTYENPSRIGPPLAYTTRSEVTLQRPDRLRVIMPGDGPVSEFYYDGKSILAFAPAENLVAVADAPPTIDGALKAAYDIGAIYFPFTDLIVADPWKEISGDMKIAFYIGQSSVIGGTTTDMVAFASDDVFVQAWIGADDKLPRMLRAVYRFDASQMRHQAEFSNWQLDGDVPADAFASAKASAATHIAFARPDPNLSAGVTPPAERKAAKAQAAKAAPAKAPAGAGAAAPAKTQ